MSARSKTRIPIRLQVVTEISTTIDHPGPEITSAFRPGYWLERFQSDGVSGTLDNDMHAGAPPEAPSITGGPWALVP